MNRSIVLVMLASLSSGCNTVNDNSVNQNIVNQRAGTIVNSNSAAVVTRNPAPVGRASRSQVVIIDGSRTLSSCPPLRDGYFFSQYTRQWYPDQAPPEEKLMRYRQDAQALGGCRYP